MKKFLLFLIVLVVVLSSCINVEETNDSNAMDSMLSESDSDYQSDKTTVGIETPHVYDEGRTIGYWAYTLEEYNHEQNVELRNEFGFPHYEDMKLLGEFEYSIAEGYVLEDGNLEWLTNYHVLKDVSGEKYRITAEIHAYEDYDPKKDAYVMDRIPEDNMRVKIDQTPKSVCYIEDIAYIYEEGYLSKIYWERDGIDYFIWFNGETPYEYSGDDISIYGQLFNVKTAVAARDAIYELYKPTKPINIATAP